MPSARDLPDEGHQLADEAAELLRRIKAKDLKLTTAESCTGGLLSSLFTDIEGLSDTFDRGFVTYSEEAKCDLLGIEPIVLRRHGAVSAETATAMVDGALARSNADIAGAVTGYAGQSGDGGEAGLVHLAVRPKNGQLVHPECHFGKRRRDEVRHLAARAALETLDKVLGQTAKTAR